MITFRSMIVKADKLPSVSEVIAAARTHGVDIRFEDGFDFRTNPRNRAGRVGVTLNGRVGEFGYAIDPLWLLIDKQELPSEAAKHGDSFVTIGVTTGFEPVAAATECYFAKEFDVHGWRADKIVAPHHLARDASAELQTTREQNQPNA